MPRTVNYICDEHVCMKAAAFCRTRKDNVWSLLGQSKTWRDQDGVIYGCSLAHCNLIDSALETEKRMP
jgi:hypothetical protein